SLVAAAEYQRTTGDARFLPWMRELAGFLRYMQLPDGDFRHFYQPDRDLRDEKTRAPYYSGEASLALARFAALLPDGADYAAAAYGFGALLPPHTTPAGSRSECLLSVLRLDRRAGLPTAEVEAQLRLSMQFLLARQFSGDDWRFPNPAAAGGGIPQSDVNLSI